jgi:hypothetical protein
MLQKHSTIQNENSTTACTTYQARPLCPCLNPAIAASLLSAQIQTFTRRATWQMQNNKTNSPFLRVQRLRLHLWLPESLRLTLPKRLAREVARCTLCLRTCSNLGGQTRTTASFSNRSPKCLRTHHKKPRDQLPSELSLANTNRTPLGLFKADMEWAAFILQTLVFRAIEIIRETCPPFPLIPPFTVE